MAAGVETYDWRTGLQPDSRQRIVNKITDTLKRHLPFSGEEGLRELNKIVVKFEQRIYDAATDQSEYLRTISLKMLTMETKSQKPVVNSLQSNAASNIKNSQGAGNTIDGDWLEEIFQKKLVMAAGVETDDWRTQLLPDSRQRIVTKIMDTLKRHLPFSGEEGLQELNTIVVRFEQKIYDAATDQSDYLRKISMKMLTIETKSHNPNSLQFNSASSIENFQDTGDEELGSGGGNA